MAYDKKKYKSTTLRNMIILNEIKSKGGCLICGYGRCNSALHFHHLDPSSRYRAGNKKHHTDLILTGTERMLIEVKKCILVCANCHAEIHTGLHPKYLIEREIVPQESPQLEFEFGL